MVRFALGKSVEDAFRSPLAVPYAVPSSSTVTSIQLSTTRAPRWTSPSPGWVDRSTLLHDASTCSPYRLHIVFA